MYKSNKERKSTVGASYIGERPEKAFAVVERAVTYRTYDKQTDIISPLEVLQFLGLCRPEFIKKYVNGALDPFLFTVNISFSPDIYKVLSKNLPVVFECEITAVQKSSFHFASQLSVPGHQPLLTEHGSSVMVDLAKRRSLPFPDSFMERFKHLRNKQESQRWKQMEVPLRTLCQGLVSIPFTVKVPRRHRDSNNHVTSSAYVEYCIDALELHLLRDDVVCNFNTGCLLLKHIQMIYWRECSPGDILHVAFWDEEGDNSTVCFHMAKSGICIFEAKMQFFAKDILKKIESKL